MLPKCHVEAPVEARTERRPAGRLRLAMHAVVAATLLALPTIALAQQVTAAPPEPRVTRTYPVFVGYIFMFLFIVIIVGVSLMPSKRAHQD